MEAIPTEILTHIFKYLCPKQRAKCRQVCWKWKRIVNYMSLNQKLWKDHCIQDFGSIYIAAFKHRTPGITWGNLYRSLTLWSKIHEANESKDEFAFASCCMDEIKDFRVLPNGVIGVLTRVAVKYYDTLTLKPSKHSTIHGKYLEYAENEDTVVLLGQRFHLYVQRKVIYDPKSKLGATFDNVKTFLLDDTILVFGTGENEIFLCDLKDINLKTIRLFKSDDGILSISQQNGRIHILTFERKVYTVVGKQLVFTCKLEPSTDLLHELNQFNFLENLDWRVYFDWMFLLQNQPPGPLRDIIIIKNYGDIVFVGSNWGVLRIYHNPYIDGKFDLFRCNPVRQYNFRERYSNPVLSMCPITQIFVVEGVDSHMLLVAMPKKIVILNFTYNLAAQNNEDILDFEDMEED